VFQKNKILKSFSIIALLSIVGRGLGLIRDILFASIYGAGEKSDVYFLSNTLLALITMYMLQAVTTTMVPSLSRIESNYSSDEKNVFTNNVLHFVLFGALLISTIIWVLLPTIGRFIAPGFNTYQFDLFIRLVRVGLPSVMVLGIVSVFKGFLHSELRFVETAISELTPSIIFIVVILFFVIGYGIESMMVALVISSFVQLIIHGVGLFNTNYKYRLSFNIKNKDLQGMLLLAMPVFFSTIITNINQIIDRSMASSLPSGSISALSYANQVNTISMSLFIFPIVTVIFPVLTNAASNNNHKKFINTFEKGLSSIVLITVPMTIGLVILSEPIIIVLFQRGAFNSDASRISSEALMFFAFAITGNAVRLLVVKSFYSLQNTKTPLLYGCLAICIKIILNIILIPAYAHKGIAISTAISASLLGVFLLISLARQIGIIDFKKFFTTLFRVLASALIMGGVVYITYKFIFQSHFNFGLNSIPALVFTILIGVVIYGICVYLFKIEEGLRIINSIMDVLPTAKNR